MRSLPSHPMPATRVRPAGARAPGGASSLLRLSSGAARLPSSASLGDWIGRAALALRQEPLAGSAA